MDLKISQKNLFKILANLNKPDILKTGLENNISFNEAAKISDIWSQAQGLKSGMFPIEEISIPIKSPTIETEVSTVLPPILQQETEVSTVLPPILQQETEEDIIDTINKYMDNFTLNELLIKPDFFYEKSTINYNTVDNVYPIAKSDINQLIFDNDILFNSRASMSTDSVFAQKKHFLDLMTSLIAVDILPDNKQKEIFNFQYLVNNFFNKFIKEYNSKNNSKAFFMYKGGTTMKIIYSKYKKILGDRINYFDEFFERSDSDYGIIINDDNKDEYFKIYYDMNILTYNILQKIKEFMKNEKHLNQLIPLNSITLEMLKAKLAKANEKLKTLSGSNNFFADVSEFIGIKLYNKEYFSDSEAKPKNLNYEIDTEYDKKHHTLYNPKLKGGSYEVTNNFENRNISIKSDFYITFYKNSKNVWRPNIVPINNTNTNIYCYMNETNIYKIKEGNTTFVLHRMKLNIVFYFKTKNGKYGIINIPSELIDVPITRFEDYKTKFVKDTYFKKYKNINNGHELIYSGYNLIGFIHDLYIILFVENTTPWEDVKYKKRINRYLFLLVIHCLNTYKNTNNIITKLIDFINTNNPDIVLTDMNNNNHNYDYDENIKLLIEVLTKILSDTKVNNNQDFIIFKNTIIDILTRLNINLILPEVMNNMDPEPVPYLNKYLKEANRKGISMNQLFNQKYLSYKEKYLALRKLQ